MKRYVLRVRDEDPRRAGESLYDRTLDFIFFADSPTQARRLLRQACPWSGEGTRYWAVVGYQELF